MQVDDCERPDGAYELGCEEPAQGGVSVGNGGVVADQDLNAVVGVRVRRAEDSVQGRTLCQQCDAPVFGEVVAFLRGDACVPSADGG